MFDQEQIVKKLNHILDTTQTYLVGNKKAVQELKKAVLNISKDVYNGDAEKYDRESLVVLYKVAIFTLETAAKLVFSQNDAIDRQNKRITEIIELIKEFDVSEIQNN